MAQPDGLQARFVKAAQKGRYRPTLPGEIAQTMVNESDIVEELHCLLQIVST